MSLISVCGFDPSLNNWGLAKGYFDTETMKLSITELDLINPEFSSSKTVRQNSKDMERARQLAFKAASAVGDVQAVFVEVPVGSQSARAMASYGICVGVLGALRAQDIPFFEVTPTEVKMATVGKKTASKAEIIERAVAMHPKANWPTITRNGETSVVASKAEHMADAIGAIEAGIHTEQFRAVLPFISKLSA
jgi:Holliday junction resolvasome RuvABC endonuclease subunit